MLRNGRSQHYFYFQIEAKITENGSDQNTNTRSLCLKESMIVFAIVKERYLLVGLGIWYLVNVCICEEGCGILAKCGLM